MDKRLKYTIINIEKYEVTLTYYVKILQNNNLKKNNGISNERIIIDFFLHMAMCTIYLIEI